tara:strand:+ start:125923 stop:126144 length:222 start_codon:yes stop_codon:yes gene_type:complete
MSEMKHPSWAVEPIGRVPENMLPTMGSRGQGVPPIHVSKLPQTEETEEISRQGVRVRIPKKSARGGPVIGPPS